MEDLKNTENMVEIKEMKNMEDSNENGADKKEMFLEYLRFSVFTLIAMIAIFILLSFVAQRTRVNGNSMYPSLEDGQSVIVNKLSYRFSDIERFDVVIFPHYNEEYNKEINYIKRVIGMPGELISIKDGLIYIDGEVLTESYGYFSEGDTSYSGIAEEEIYIGEDEYFVLGDNRNASDDSRAFGCISKDDIIGEALMIIYPLRDLAFVK